MTSRLMATRRDFCAALTFLSRLPLCTTETAAAATVLRFAPLCGLVIACVPAVALAVARAVGLGSVPAAVLALAALIWTTGALHEDGLADVADGFGGGTTRDSKLAIMRDSRIGTFGAAALGAALLFRVACLAQILDRVGLVQALAALLVAATLSRAAMLVPMAVLPPARRDGLVQGLGALSIRTLGWALALAVTTAVAVGWAMGLAPARVALAVLAAPAVCAALALLARRQIGGVTGDVVGAGQQLAEMTVLAVLAAAAP